jgi:hypothetical protein
MSKISWFLEINVYTGNVQRWSPVLY